MKRSLCSFRFKFFLFLCLYYTNLTNKVILQTTGQIVKQTTNRPTNKTKVANI